jgi:hypothetical protein
MAKTSIALAGGREDSFDWLNRNVAQLLGTGAAGTPLRRDRALRDMTAQERAALSQRLRGRFKRVQDERTTRVRFEIAGGGAIMLGAAGRGDPELERIGRTFIPPIRAAIAEISAVRPRDHVTEEAVADGLAGVNDGLQRLEAQLRETPLSGFIRFISQEVVVLLVNFRELLVLPQAGPNDVEEAEDLIRINAASGLLGAMISQIDARLIAINGPGALGLAEFLREVQLVGPLVADGAADLLRMLGDLEIHDMQLRRIPVHPVAFPDDSIAEVLHVGAEEPARWLALAQTGSAQHRQLIEDGAGQLHAWLTELQAGARIPDLVGELGLEIGECCDDGRQVRNALRRFAAMGTAVLEKVVVPGAPFLPLGPRLIGQ